MNRILRNVLLTGLIVGLLTGCSVLSPGKKEFFQKKVPAFPEKTKVEEKQKQAATFVAEKVNLAYEEGLKSNTTNTVMEPLHEAQIVATPLAEAIGAPQKPYRGPATNLVDDLHQLESRYAASLKKLEDKLDSLEGKSIEGTGLIQIGYFSFIFFLVILLVILVGVLWVVLKIVGIFNPPVALGASAISAGAGLLRRGFGEVIEAGEKFKDMVKEKVEDPETQQHILELFRQAHLESQSRDVQTVIKHLTSDPNDPKKLAKALSS